MRERLFSLLVTFYRDVPKVEVYDFFDSFGGKVFHVHAIPNLLLKRYTVDVEESQFDDFVDKFNASELVMSVHANKTELPRRTTFDTKRKTK